MPAWPNADEVNVIGQRIQRIDGPDKVTGKAKFTYDINLPGMLYGKILRCPHPHARVVQIDTSKAAKLKGVKVVHMVKEAGQICFYAGDEVAAVAAINENIAMDAIQLIKVEYKELPFVVDVEEAMQPGAPKVHEEKDNVSKGNLEQRGDVEAAFADEDIVTIEATYKAQVQTHSCYETHGHVVRWDDDEHLTVWASTQAVFGVRDGFVQYFNLPASNVRVITEHMGGGLGSKFAPRPEGIIAADLARKAKAPVKLMLSRYEEQLCSGNRPSAAVKLKAAAKKDGTLVAIDCTTYGTGGVNSGAGFPFPYVYNVPNFRRQHSDVFINAGDGTAMRAPGHPPACFLTESMMDDLAAKLGIDPLEFRRKNLDPESNRTPVWQEQYTIGAREIGWHKHNKIPGAGKVAKKRGIGMASCLWWGGGGKGTQVQASIHPDGTVKVVTGSQDLGTGTWTFVAMVAAEELGLQPKDITVKIGDSQPELPSAGSGGSVTAPSVSPAVKMAVDKARDELFQIVAPKLNVAPEELMAKDGKIYPKSDITQALLWKETTALLGTDTITVQDGWAEGLSESDVSGVQFAEVEVDTETGEVKVLNMVAVQDCGLVLNLLTAESQVIGGMIQSLSYVLLEDRLMDVPTGIMLNPNLGDYKIAGTVEMPEMKPIMFDTDRKVTGLGEPPAIPGAGAIANAIYNAIGVRIHDMPITPDKILQALTEKEG